MKLSHSHPNIQTGFTLVELMIVVAVIAILASVGGIALNSQMPKYRLRGDAKAIASSLMVARMKATSTGLQYRIEFNLGASPQEYRLQRGGGSWSNESYRRELSFGVSIKKINNNVGGLQRITFNPNGSSASGEGNILLSLGSLSEGYQISLTPATGRIQNQKASW